MTRTTKVPMADRAQYIALIDRLSEILRNKGVDHKIALGTTFRNGGKVIERSLIVYMRDDHDGCMADIDGVPIHWRTAN